MPPRKTKEQFVEAAVKIHGDKYSYENFVYVTSTSKGLITCPDHGDWEQTPGGHINSGHGCQDCRKSALSLRFRNTLESTVKKFKKVHGDRYDYREFQYVNSKTKSTVICNIHGSWEINANKHLLGRGCPECGKSSKFLRKMLEGSESLRYIPRWLYGVWFYHKDSNSSFYKIGVCDTGGIEKRYMPTMLKSDGLVIISTQIVALNNYEALTSELYVLRKFVDKKVNTCGIMKKCAGGTETFSINLNETYPNLNDLIDEALATPLNIKTSHVPYNPNSTEYVNYRVVP